MLTLADTDTVVVGGLGGAILLIQFLQLIFKRRDEKDPDVIASRAEARANSALISQIAISISTIESKISGFNDKFEKQVLAHAIEYQRTLDAINAVNTTLHRRVDGLDATVRGNGKEGLTEIAARHDAEIHAMRQRVERFIETHGKE